MHLTPSGVRQHEPRHDKTNKVRPVWSESSLSAWRKLGSLATQWAHSEDSDQTGWMPMLIWVFAGCTVILLVLSWGGSHFLAPVSQAGTSQAGTSMQEKSIKVHLQKKSSHWTVSSLIKIPHSQNWTVTNDSEGVIVRTCLFRIHQAIRLGLCLELPCIYRLLRPRTLNPQRLQNNDLQSLQTISGFGSKPR